MERTKGKSRRAAQWTRDQILAWTKGVAGRALVAIGCDRAGERPIGELGSWVDPGAGKIGMIRQGIADRIEIYRDRSGLYRGQILARNGRILADFAESYVQLEKLLNVVVPIAGALAVPVFSRLPISDRAKVAK